MVGECRGQRRNIGVQAVNLGKLRVWFRRGSGGEAGMQLTCIAETPALMCCQVTMLGAEK